MKTDDELRTMLRNRIAVQRRAIDGAREMLEGEARDYGHLMRRIALRATIARAEENIKRLEQRL